MSGIKATWKKKSSFVKKIFVKEAEARNIGTAFLKNKNLDINDYGERDKLGEGSDYNIFFAFPIVAEDGDFYIGGSVLLIDKRTSFCLLAAGSPNFYDYHIKLFRIIIINHLYDSEIDLESYQKKKENIDYGHFIQAIFLLLNSHPDNYNAFSEFLDIISLLDSTENTNEIIEELNYKSLSLNVSTLEIFFKGLAFFKSKPQIILKIDKLEKVLSNKNLTIAELSKKYESILIKRQKEIDEFKEFIRKENEK